MFNYSQTSFNGEPFAANVALQVFCGPVGRGHVAGEGDLVAEAFAASLALDARFLAAFALVVTDVAKERVLQGELFATIWTQ